MIVVTHEQILAYRLAAHALDRRLPPEALFSVVGACGVQNTPPGAAELSLYARLEGLQPGRVARMLEGEKSLLQAWSLRGAPHLFPTTEAPVFTRGLLPPDEHSLRAFLYGAVPALDRLGLRATELVEKVSAALLELLDGRALTKDELGFSIAEKISPSLPPQQRTIWQESSPYAARQTLGESLARFALPVAALCGLCCHAERQGAKAFFRRTDQWLRASTPSSEDQSAPLELLRRYLHCYGPSTSEHFAAWAGISPGQAKLVWDQLLPELTVIGYTKKAAFLLASDLPLLLSPPAARGARLLPAHDPLLQLRDRLTLLPRPDLHPQVWRTSGSPGVILADGECLGTWRMQKKSGRLEISLSFFSPPEAFTRAAIESEAATLAPLRNCINLKFSYQ